MSGECMRFEQVSLKVCEGCGTLWIRRQAGAGVYCAPCAMILRDFPDPHTRLRPGRPKKQAGVAAHARQVPAGAAYAAGGVQ